MANPTVILAALLAPAWWALLLFGYALLGDATPDGRTRVSRFFDRLEQRPAAAA